MKLTKEEIEAFKNLTPTVVELSEEDWDFFIQMLEATPEPSEALVQLMREEDE